MALETLKGLTQVNGYPIVVMDELREQHPDKFNESGAMDYRWFESEIRPHNFIYVRHDVNSVSFTIQNGPVKENGKNGCQLTELVAVALQMVKHLNQKHPCMENEATIMHLEDAIRWQERRTANREERGVEGTNTL